VALFCAIVGCTIVPWIFCDAMGPAISYIFSVDFALEEWRIAFCSFFGVGFRDFGGDVVVKTS